MIGILAHDCDDGSVVRYSLSSCVNKLERSMLVIVNATYVDSRGVVLEHNPCIVTNNAAICSPVNESASLGSRRMMSHLVDQSLSRLMERTIHYVRRYL